MLHEEILERKHVIYAKISLEMIHIIVGSRLFISHFEKQKSRVSGKFFLFSQKNLDFKPSSDIEMSLEEEENKIFKH